MLRLLGVLAVVGSACAPTRPVGETEFELTYYYLKF